VDITRLQRSPEYWEALERRLGFAVTRVYEGLRVGLPNAYLVHAAGVSFEGRQELLESARAFCGFDSVPPAELRPDPNNAYDKEAVIVSVGVHLDDMTGEFQMAQVGFLPKGRCPNCATSLSGKRADMQICPECDLNIGLSSTPEVQALSKFNKYVGDAIRAGKTVRVGVDNVTEPQTTKGNRGLDLWIRID
jgi:hypothetical protein